MNRFTTLSQPDDPPSFEKVRTPHVALPLPRRSFQSRCFEYLQPQLPPRKPRLYRGTVVSVPRVMSLMELELRGGNFAL